MPISACKTRHRVVPAGGLNLFVRAHLLLETHYGECADVIQRYLANLFGSVLRNGVAPLQRSAALLQ